MATQFVCYMSKYVSLIISVRFLSSTDLSVFEKEKENTDDNINNNADLPSKGEEGNNNLFALLNAIWPILRPCIK